MRAVGVGPAIRGRCDRREGVREMLVVWRESREAGRLLVAKLQSVRDVGRRRRRRDGSGSCDGLVGGHRVGRRKRTFEHVGSDRRRTYGTLQRRQRIRSET